MIGKLLLVSAIGECSIGLIMLIWPAQVASILLGGQLNTDTALATARVAAIAIISIGAACWFGSRDASSRAAAGIVVAMLIYDIGIAIMLLILRLTGMNGVGLLPVSALHAVLAIWCFFCLRSRLTPKQAM